MSDRDTDPGQAYAALSYLLAGLLCYGGLGWLGGRVFDTRLLTPLGLIVGLALGTYLVVRRYGRETSATREQTKGQRS